MEHDGADRLRKSPGLMRTFLHLKRPELTWTSKLQISARVSKGFMLSPTMKVQNPVFNIPLFRKKPDVFTVLRESGLYDFKTRSPHLGNLSKSPIIPRTTPPEPLSPSSTAFFLYNITNPERSRTILQTQTQLISSGIIQKPFKSFYDVMLKVGDNKSLWASFRHENFIKGNFYALLEFSLLHRFCSITNPDNFYPSFVFANLLLYPITCLRLRIATDLENRNTRPFQILQEVLRKEGLRGVYRGSMVCLVHRLLVCSTISYGLPSLKQDDPAINSLLVNLGLSKSLILFYPLETIFKRLHVGGLNENFLMCLREGSLGIGLPIFIGGLIVVLSQTFVIDSMFNILKPSMDENLHPMIVKFVEIVLKMFSDVAPGNGKAEPREVVLDDGADLDKSTCREAVLDREVVLDDGADLDKSTCRGAVLDDGADRDN